MQQLSDTNAWSYRHITLRTIRNTCSCIIPPNPARNDIQRLGQVVGPKAMELAGLGAQPVGRLLYLFFRADWAMVGRWPGVIPALFANSNI